MFKSYRFVLALVAVCLLGCSAAYAQNPTVQLLSFDPATSTYVYQVTQGLDAVDSLTEFTVLALTSASDPYTMTSPSTGGFIGGWMTGRTSWINPDTGRSGIAYQWYNGYVKKGSGLAEPWVGEFAITIPGTQPVPGLVNTMGGSQVIVSHAVSVPGPIVPEPGSIVALGGMLLGMGPLALRYRRR